MVARDGVGFLVGDICALRPRLLLRSNKCLTRRQPVRALCGKVVLQLAVEIIACPGENSMLVTNPTSLSAPKPPYLGQSKSCTIVIRG